MSFGVILIISVFLILFFYPDIKASIESEGVFKYDKKSIKNNAKVSNVHAGTAGSKLKRRFRVVVQFNDGSKYIKVVEPGTTETYVGTQRIMLFPEQQAEVVEEAIKKHDECLNNFININKKEDEIINIPNKNKASKEELIDKVINVTNDVFNKLNGYMISNPEAILDPTKQKRLDKDEKGIDITNASKCDLISYYCAVIEYWSGNKDFSNNIINYCNEHLSMMTLNIPEAQNKLKDFTKHLIELKVATHIKRMNATKGYGAKQLINILGDNLLNEYFNQKCSEYNTTILRNSVEKILEIIK